MLGSIYISLSPCTISHIIEGILGTQWTQGGFSPRAAIIRAVSQAVSQENFRDTVDTRYF